MRKSDKKLEKNIVSALTDVCELDLKVYEGFQWLTHLVNFQSFPNSFTIICIFDSNESVNKLIETDKVHSFKSCIESRLFSNEIKVKDIKKRILFDTEEACELEHNGNWNKRLEGLQNARHC